MDNMRSNQYTILKDVVSSIKNGKAFNLKELLEFLNSSTDVDVQVKLFSVLSAYLMSNYGNIEPIVTYNPLYDKISKILANCPPRKTTIAFNFLSALLYVDDEDSHRKSSLVAYARNMIRSSGCLATMCDLFTTCMMHQDAWRALCRCLAESCRGVDVNQSYCTHLVPMCIQRCSQRNIEVLLVLQSLLQHHNRNITLFVECNGISLFQREFLHHDICLQLLATIVQSSTEAVALIAKTGICQQLRDFLQMYGPQSQLGQWSTIVLYHTSRVEASCEDPKVDEVGKENKKLSESLLAKLRLADQKRHKECSADTTKFIQNVMKEILQCGAQKEFNNLKAFFPPDVMTNRSLKNTVNYDSKIPFHDVPQRNHCCMAPQDPNNFYVRSVKPTIIENYSVQCNKTNELSFSFLQKRNSNRKHVAKNFVPADKLPECFQRTFQTKPTLIQNDSVQCNKTNELSFTFLRKQNSNRKHVAKNFVTEDKLPECFQKTFQTNETRIRKNTVYESLMEIDESQLNTLGTNDFNPRFASTPNRNDLYENSNYENQRSNNYTVRTIQKSIRNHKIKRQLQKKKIAKHLERSKIDKEIKHKSFSGRFFDVINTSCTTLVKTVKNIFRPKNDFHETENDTDSLSKTPNRDTLACSFSFTNYMRRRDAAFKNDCPNKSGGGIEFLKPKANVEDFSIEMSNSCNTCNNTIALKRKLVSDDNLKLTIRKLKLGINLYGCNFKKISRTMWPKENYMTPAVLYNLYRKLIIK